MQGAGGIIWAIPKGKDVLGVLGFLPQVFLSSLCCCRFESGEQDIVRVNAFHLKRIARVPTVQGSSTPSIKSHPESIVQEGSGEIFSMLAAFPYCWTCTLKRIIKQLPLIHQYQTHLDRSARWSGQYAFSRPDTVVTEARRGSRGDFSPSLESESGSNLVLIFSL